MISLREGRRSRSQDEYVGNPDSGCQQSPSGRRGPLTKPRVCRSQEIILTHSPGGWIIRSVMKGSTHLSASCGHGAEVIPESLRDRRAKVDQ
jgi:hypothetical protein